MSPEDLVPAEEERTPLPRSPALMNREDTALLVVDVQTRLLAVIPEHERLVWNISRLVSGAEVLGVPRIGTEQYPEKLGATAAEIRDRIETCPGKQAFSCGEYGELFRQWRADDRHRVLLCGLEAHVCVQQTALDLLADGFSVYLAVDAVATRHAVDYEFALRRMEISGVTLTTVEAALFEWCREAGTPEFKQISALAKQAPPP